MSAPAPIPLDRVRIAMAATNEIFNLEVFGRRNYAALDQVYTSAAQILPPGAPMISGREAIKTFWANLIEAVNATSAVLSSLEVMPAGDGIVEIGRARLTIQPQGQPETSMEVKYVVYWQQENGQWKWHVDIWNQDA